MRIYYKGYWIECMNNEAWDGAFKSKTLVAWKEDGNPDSNEKIFIISKWWQGTIREGIRSGKKRVDALLTKAG